MKKIIVISDLNDGSKVTTIVNENNSLEVVNNTTSTSPLVTSNSNNAALSVLPVFKREIPEDSLIFPTKKIKRKRHKSYFGRSYEYDSRAVFSKKYKKGR